MLFTEMHMNLTHSGFALTVKHLLCCMFDVFSLNVNPVLLREPPSMRFPCFRSERAYFNTLRGNSDVSYYKEKNREAERKESVIILTKTLKLLQHKCKNQKETSFIHPIILDHRDSDVPVLTSKIKNF